MGQKIHPTGYRIGIIEPWSSRWHGGKNFAAFLLQDKHIRDHVRKEYGSAGIPRIEIERTGEAVNVVIFTARPGVLVGRKGVRIRDTFIRYCGVRLHTIETLDRKRERKATAVDPQSSIGIGGLSFRVPDIEKSHAETVARGLSPTPIYDFDQLAAPVRMYFLDDPDGIRLEMIGA